MFFIVGLLYLYEGYLRIPKQIAELKLENINTAIIKVLERRRDSRQKFASFYLIIGLIVILLEYLANGLKAGIT